MYILKIKKDYYYFQFDEHENIKMSIILLFIWQSFYPEAFHETNIQSSLIKFIFISLQDEDSSIQNVGTIFPRNVIRKVHYIRLLLTPGHHLI